MRRATYSLCQSALGKHFVACMAVPSGPSVRKPDFLIDIGFTT